MILPQLVSGMTTYEYGLVLFLLVFSMTYSMLEKLEVFRRKRDLSAVVSLTIGIITATTLWMDNVLLIAVPVFVGIILFVFFIFITMAMAYGDIETIPLKVKRLAIVMAVVLVAFFIFWVLAGGFMDYIGGALNGAFNGTVVNAPVNTTIPAVGGA